MFVLYLVEPGFVTNPSRRFYRFCTGSGGLIQIRVLIQPRLGLLNGSLFSTLNLDWNQYQSSFLLFTIDE